MEDFSRILWSSQPTRKLWEARIHHICNEWTRIETASVFSGYRTASLQLDSWPDKRLGFVTVGLGVQGKADNYSASSPGYVAGKPFSVRTVTIRTERLSDFVAAWHDRNDEEIGLLLGFPGCCVEFFKQTWGRGLHDPTEKMQVSNPHTSPYTNILLRWLGVRPVPHMPCSLECEVTKMQGETYLGMMDERARAWSRELLSMSMEYKTLNGVGEVTTPLFKLAFTSQGKREFKLFGTQPDGAAAGIKFPFIEDVWTNNGFKGLNSMIESHKVIRSILPLTKLNKVIDFGCGNGYLLFSISAMHKTGIDINGTAIIQGRKLFPQIVYRIDNIDEVITARHDLSLIMLGRLEESKNPEYVLNQLANQTVVYTYGDWCDKFQDLLSKHFTAWKIIDVVYSPHTRAALLRRMS